MSGNAEDDVDGRRGSSAEHEEMRSLVQHFIISGVWGYLDERKQLRPTIARRVGESRQHFVHCRMHTPGSMSLLWMVRHRSCFLETKYDLQRFSEVVFEVEPLIRVESLRWENTRKRCDQQALELM